MSIPIKLKRKGSTQQPSVSLEICQIDLKKTGEGYALLISGDPVLLGVVPPLIDIGGMSPVKIYPSQDQKYAAGWIKELPESNEVLIDYGFTQSRCNIERKTFSKDQIQLFKKITKRTLHTPQRPGFLRLLFLRLLNRIFSK